MCDLWHLFSKKGSGRGAAPENSIKIIIVPWTLKITGAVKNAATSKNVDLLGNRKVFESRKIGLKLTCRCSTHSTFVIYVFHPQFSILAPKSLRHPLRPVKPPHIRRGKREIGGRPRQRIRPHRYPAHQIARSQHDIPLPHLSIHPKAKHVIRPHRTRADHRIRHPRQNEQRDAVRRHRIAENISGKTHVAQMRDAPPPSGSAGDVAFNCHTCAVPMFGKFVTLIVTAAFVVACLLITITVKAPSLDRVAAKVETLSGFGPIAATLVSPKPDLFPS